MSQFNQKIRTGLRKDAAALLDELAIRIPDRSSLETRLQAIAELLEQENQLTLERKKVSRQVGAARKVNEDPAELIARVSEISKQIKQLAAKADDEIAQIAGEFESSAPSEQALPQLPSHLQRAESVLARGEDEDEGALTLAHTDTPDASQWREFTESINHSNIYHDVKWCDLIKSNFGHTPYYITCRKSDGGLCGVFPVIHMNSRLFGSFLISMPYFNYGGPLSEYALVEQKMMDYAAELGAKLDCSHLEVRETHPRDNWLSKQHKVTMILPLPEDDKTLDAQLGSKVRAQVKRAAREDLEFSLGGVDLLTDFYRVFSQNMRDLGTPVYSKQFFKSILESFPDEASLAIVTHKHKPVAAGFLLGHRDKLEIPWASSLRKANPLGANMYMYRQILRSAIEQRYQYFDFGRSSPQASTYQYKKQWGAQEHPLYWHYWMQGEQELPELNPNNPKYKLAIGVWQHLPVSIANAIGPKVVRNLP